MKVPAGWVPGEGSLPGLRTATFSLGPQMADRQERSGVSADKDADPTLGPHPHDLIETTTPQRPHFPTITLSGGMELQHRITGGHKHAVPSTPLMGSQRAAITQVTSPPEVTPQDQSLPTGAAHVAGRSDRAIRGRE